MSPIQPSTITRPFDQEDLLKPAPGSKFKLSEGADELWILTPPPTVNPQFGLALAEESESRPSRHRPVRTQPQDAGGPDNIASVAGPVAGAPVFGQMSYESLEVDGDLSTGAAFKQAFKEAYPNRHKYKFSTNRLLSRNYSRLEGYIAGSTAFTFLFQVRSLQNTLGEVGFEGSLGAWLRVSVRASQTDSWSTLFYAGDHYDVPVFQDTTTMAALSHQWQTGAFYRFEVYPASSLYDATFHAGVGFFGFFI